MPFRFSLSTQLIFVILFVLFFGSFVPAYLVSFFYTVSMIFKELLTFILPFMVFAFVTHGIMALKEGAPLILLILLASIFASNALVSLGTYTIVSMLIRYITHTVDITQLQANNCIEPLCSITLPHIIRTEKALLLAIVVGLLHYFFKFNYAQQAVHYTKRTVEWLLLKFFVPFLPLYILGFLLKMHFEGMFSLLVHNYTGAFLVIICVQWLVLITIYLIACNGSFERAQRAIINAMPSYLTAFGTMSSSVTVPVSINCAVKNTNNRSLADVAMPIMANVHLLGDSVSIPVLALITLQIFTGAIPALSTYLIFVFYFCTTMFAVSGVPGGGIIVMMPILINLFGFTSEMASIITALYVLLDSFGTGANVMGDGALIIIVNNILTKLGLNKSSSSQTTRSEHNHIR